MSKTVTVTFAIPDDAPDGLKAFAGQTLAGTFKTTKMTGGDWEGKTRIDPIIGAVPNGFGRGSFRNPSAFLEGAGTKTAGKSNASSDADAIRVLDELGVWTTAHAGARARRPDWAAMSPGQFVKLAKDASSDIGKAVASLQAAYDVMETDTTPSATNTD